VLNAEVYLQWLDLQWLYDILEAYFENKSYLEDINDYVDDQGLCWFCEKTTHGGQFNTKRNE